MASASAASSMPTIPASSIERPARSPRCSGPVAPIRHAALSTLDMIGDAERTTLDAFNATDLDYDRTATVATLFHAQAARTPDRPAASFGDRTLSYAELEAAAAAIGRRLAAAGIGRHDRVGIAVPRGLDMLAGVIATLDLGAAYVPLDPTYPIDRLQFMVGDSGIKALLATGATALQLGRTRHRGRRSGRRANRRRGDREPDRRPRSSRPRLRDLHVGLDGQAQGRACSSTAT